MTVRKATLQNSIAEKINVLIPHSFLELFNTIFVRFLVLGLNFLATTLITRSLSVIDRGKYAILLNLVSLLMTFLSFGFHSATVYFLAKNKGLFSFFYMISIWLTVLSMVVLFFLSLGNFFGFLFPTLNETDNYILVFGVPFVLMSYFSSFFFLSLNEFNKYNSMEFVKTLVFLILTVVSYNYAIEYGTYITYFVVANIIHILLSCYIFYRLGILKFTDVTLFKNIKSQLSLIKESFNFSMMSNASCILAFMLSKYCLFFLGSYFDTDFTQEQELGYYSVALANIDVISILPTTLAFYIFPKIAASEGLKNKIDIVSKMIFICVLFFGCVGVVSYFFLTDIFNILYGPLYNESVPMFQLFLPSALFLSIISCISSFIGGIGMERTAIYAPLWALIFMIGCSMYLMSVSFNIYNFIYVQNFAYFIYLVIYTRFFLKKWKESKNVKESLCSLSTIIRND